MKIWLAGLALVGMTAAAQTGNTPVKVYAAGSLRAPLTQAALAFEARQPGQRIELVFGASGLLRERIAGGEVADVFASANMAHPQSLASFGYGATHVFARNGLCALVRPGLNLTPQTLVAALLDRSLKLGISTPLADPSGDYAFVLFERVEQSGSGPEGSAALLKSRALQLTGGPHSPRPPADRNVYGVLVARGQADIFMTYCTNALIAQGEQPSLQVVQVPVQINVSADYGLAVRRTSTPAAQLFANYLLSAPGQGVLARYGFRTP